MPVVAQSAQEESTWQRRMLPLMAQMLVILTFFFFVVSLVQLTYLQWNIRKAPPVAVSALSEPLNAQTFEERLRVAHFRALVELESGALQRRHHQANVLLMARVWTRYMGFVTGMILALVGAVFTLGKLQTAVGDGPPSKLDLARSSPGIIMIGLGVALMISTIVVNHRIEVTDQPSWARLIEGSAPLPDEPGSKPAMPSPEELARRPLLPADSSRRPLP